MPDGKTWKERYPFLGNVGQFLVSPLSSPEYQQASSRLRYQFFGMPFKPLSKNTWQRGEPNERRFLGYTDRLRFEATIKALPLISSGWQVTGARQYKEWGKQEKEEGFYLLDPWGDKWTIALNNLGGVNLENISARLPKPTYQFLEEIRDGRLDRKHNRSSS